MAIKHASDAHKSRELAANRYSVVFSAQAFNLGDIGYLGAIRTANGWQWVSGEAWGYTSWNPGEPN